MVFNMPLSEAEKIHFCGHISFSLSLMFLCWALFYTLSQVLNKFNRGQKLNLLLRIYSRAGIMKYKTGLKRSPNLTL